MKKKFLFLNKKEFLSVFILLCISLMPFSWLRGGYTVLGHDSGLPVSPIAHFSDRLQTWTDRYDAGGDQTFALGGFFIHGLEALIALTGFSLSTQQAIQFSLYIFLIGVSMYFFCKMSWGRDSELLAVSAAVFYQINHFVLQGWFIAERTKFSLYIALPLLLVLFYKLFTSKVSPIKIGILSALVLFFLNGGGFLPLFAGVFISLGVWTLVLLRSTEHFTITFRKFLIYCLTFFVFNLILQLYWILPYAIYVKNNFQAEVNQAGGTEGVVNWVLSISQNTSYLNLFKLQGIQEWYVNEQHPYAKIYFSSRFLMLSAYIFVFVLVFNAFKIARNKRVLQLTCLATVLVSIFFMAGSHAPFGGIYLWMIKHVPGFIAFRTPYYKFAPAFFVSYAPLLGFAIASFFKFKFVKRLPYLLKVFIPVGLLCLYFFPFFTINFFQYTNELSTKVKVPQYVFEFASRSNSAEYPYRRTALIPGNNPENSVHSYTWGYWSLASLESLLDRHAYITPSYGFTLNKKMVVDLYAALRNNDPVWEQLADHLQIDSLLVQKDFVPYKYKGVEISADSYVKAIQSSARVKLEEDFGEWQLYSFEKKLSPIADSYVEVQDQTEQFGTASFVHQLFKNPKIVFSDRPMNDNLITRSGYVIFPQCQDCLLLRTQVYFANPNIIVTPGSTLESFNSLFLVFSKNNQALPPVDTLQSLYVIQASFNRKGESGGRIAIWQRYTTGLDLYQKEIDKTLKNFDRTTTQNALLQGYYNNLLFQLSNLKDISNLINTKDEADMFLSNVKTVKELIGRIESQIVSTKIVHSNVFLADVQEKNNFSVYVHQPSLNQYKSNLQNKITVHFDNSELSTQINPSSEWVKVGTVELDKGGQKITVDDIPLDNSSYFSEQIRNGSASQEGLSVEFGATQPCTTMPIGELTDNRYNLSFEIKSNLGEVEPSFHIVTTDDVSPELPFWGVKQKVTDGSWKKILLPFAGLSHKQYLFKICDTSAKENAELSIRNLNLDRAVEPLVALVSVSGSEPTNTLTPLMTFTSQNNTHYDINIQNPYKGVLRLPLASNSYWKPSDSSLENTRVDGAMLGYYIDEKTESENFTISYEIQKYYVAAWVISVSGFIVAIIYLLFSVIKNYAAEASTKR
ncbi:MAG: hypothetical protein ABI425_00935 [Patescibacteria group bacterium]